MNTLPNEIILIVFDYIQKITDKRQFLKTCILYNKITKQSLINFENDMCVIYFQKIYDIYRDVLIALNYDIMVNQFKHTYMNKLCPEKFIIELSHDDYPDLIPKSYLNTIDNTMLMKICATYNNVTLLEKYSKTEKEISQWSRNGNIPDIELISWYGARNGHVSVLEFCKNNGHNITYHVCNNAAANGHVNVLKWYIENGYVWHEHSSTFAAYYGHVDIIKWIMKSGFNLDLQTFNRAAIAGHINILKLGIQKKYIFGILICKNAAQGGYLNVLKWLKQNNHPFDADICISYAYNGLADTKKWAKNCGNYPESQDYINKILQKQNDVIIWAQNGCLI